jgi:hypothetical protein
MATPVAALAFNSLRGKSFFLSNYAPTHLICIDSDARYPMFPASGCGGWTALTVLTRLFSEVNATTNNFWFLVVKNHSSTRTCGIKVAVDGEATSFHSLVFRWSESTWDTGFWMRIWLAYSIGNDSSPIFPLPIHYAATAGNMELIIQLVGSVGDEEWYVSAGLGFGCDGEFGGKGYMSGYTWALRKSEGIKSAVGIPTVIEGWLPTLTESLGDTQSNQRLGLIVGIRVFTSGYGTWSTKRRKTPRNPWIVSTNTKQVAIVWVCPVSKNIFLPNRQLSTWLLFRHFSPLTLLLQFHISEPPIWRANPKSNSLWSKRWDQIQDWQN